MIVKRFILFVFAIFITAIKTLIYLVIFIAVFLWSGKIYKYSRMSKCWSLSDNKLRHVFIACDRDPICTIFRITKDFRRARIEIPSMFYYENKTTRVVLNYKSYSDLIEVRKAESNMRSILEENFNKAIKSNEVTK